MGLKLVKHFTYRSALLQHRADTLIFPCSEVMRELEKQLADLAKTRPDNHTVYVVTGVFGDPNRQLAIGFSDDECCMSSHIVKWDSHNYSETRNVELELEGDFIEGE
jgi:hypothetical protein